MSTDRSIGEAQVALKRIREELEQRSLAAVRRLLPDQEIAAVCRAVGLAWRRRLLTPTIAVWHLLLAALWPEFSFAASWQSLWQQLVAGLPGAAGRSPGSGALAKARARVPLAVWERLFGGLAARLATLGEAVNRWRGLRVVLLDGLTVSMPDQPALLEEFGTGHGGKRRGRYRYPLARLVVLALAESLTLLGYRVGGYRESEAALADELLAALRPGDLLVADRYFAAAHYYARYLAAGVQFLTRMHQRQKVGRLPRLIEYAQGDFVTRLPINPVYRRRDPQLPEAVTVRLLQVPARIRGRREVIWLASSLLDAEAYPAREVAERYLRRWRIETLIREAKVGLGADVLRSRTPAGVRKELAARLAALNLVRGLMLEAALAHGVAPLRLSFVGARRALLNFAPALAVTPSERQAEVWAALFLELAAQRVPERPGRHEPREVRREKKHYPALRSTRRDWRRHHAA